MASRNTLRPHPRMIADDRTTIQAIQELADYTPLNPACTVASLTAAEATLAAAEQRVDSLGRALAQARTELELAARTLHERTLDAKAQVIAQYGSDSTAVQAIGLIRKSARRRPTRRAAPVGEGPTG